MNRCAVGIGPRQPFIAWTQQVQIERPLPPGAYEHGLYLLPTFQCREEAWVVLEQACEAIFCNELVSSSRDPATWPHPRNLALFQEWFEIRFYDIACDQGDEPLIHFESNASLEEELRRVLSPSASG